MNYLWDLIITVVDCGAHQPPLNGTVDTYSSTTEGSSITYHCNMGLFPVNKLVSVYWAVDTRPNRALMVGLSLTLTATLQREQWFTTTVTLSNACYQLRGWLQCVAVMGRHLIQLTISATDLTMVYCSNNELFVGSDYHCSWLWCSSTST